MWESETQQPNWEWIRANISFQQRNENQDEKHFCLQQICFSFSFRLSNRNKNISCWTLFHNLTDSVYIRPVRLSMCLRFVFAVKYYLFEFVRFPNFCYFHFFFLCMSKADEWMCLKIVFLRRQPNRAILFSRKHCQWKRHSRQMCLLRLFTERNKVKKL